MGIIYVYGHFSAFYRLVYYCLRQAIKFFWGVINNGYWYPWGLQGGV